MIYIKTFEQIKDIYIKSDFFIITTTDEKYFLWSKNDRHILFPIDELEELFKVNRNNFGDSITDGIKIRNNDEYNDMLKTIKNKIIFIGKSLNILMGKYINVDKLYWNNLLTEKEIELVQSINFKFKKIEFIEGVSKKSRDYIDL